MLLFGTHLQDARQGLILRMFKVAQKKASVCAELKTILYSFSW